MFSMKLHRRLPGLAIAAAAGALFAAAPASASSFQCTASAIRGSVLTQTGLEPVVANGGQQDCQPASASLDNLPAPLGLDGEHAPFRVRRDGAHASRPSK